jgi:carbon monoxide dehydrogenase subunit G
MAIKIDKTFVLDAPIEQVWIFVTDPSQVVSCLPGAAISEKIDERTYTGTITVKVGPVTTSYKGKAQFERVDEDRFEAELIGRAQDVKGKGSAEVRMVTSLRSSENGKTEVHMISEVALIGPLAQFGGRLLQDVADQLIQQSIHAMNQKLASQEGPALDSTNTTVEPMKAIPFAFKIFWRAVVRLFRRIFGTAEIS